MKKYELTSETKTWFGRTLFRIRAVAGFGVVVEGELGGFIESEKNLSQDGQAWVCGEAQVCGEARVYGEAQVYGEARVYGQARVCGEAQVCGEARVCGEAQVYGQARVYGEAQVCGEARVYGEARVSAPKDHISISPIGSEGGVFTAFRTEAGIECSRGCFHGTLDEFEEAVKETHGENRYAQEYAQVIALVRLRMDTEKAAFGPNQ